MQQEDKANVLFLAVLLSTEEKNHLILKAGEAIVECYIMLSLQSSSSEVWLIPVICLGDSA
jgi:hypothetical protein